MSDFCYSGPMLNRVLQQAELMDRMIARLGVAPAAAARLEKGMARYEARSHCIACHNESKWPRAHAEPADEPPGFCGNFAFFRRYEPQQVHAGPSLLMEDHNERLNDPRQIWWQMATRTVPT